MSDLSSVNAAAVNRKATGAVAYISHGGGPLPLHVCYGIAKSPAARTLQFEVMGIRASASIWQ